MRNKTKSRIALIAFALIAFSFIANSEHPRCDDACVPAPDEICSVGTGDPNNPVAFCEGRINMKQIPTID
jgi:hypothetical protein